MIPNIPTLPSKGITTEVIQDIVPFNRDAAPTRIALVACGVKIHFPWEKTCARYARVREHIEASLGDYPVEVVAAPEPYEDADELVRFLDNQIANGLGGVILFHAAYTAGEIGSYMGRWLLEHPMPIMSWSFPDEQTFANNEANSLCCQNFILGMWKQMGVAYAWMHRDMDASATPLLQRFARSVRARSRFRRGRLLHIGGSRVSAFYDGEVNELEVMKRFGVRFDRIDHEVAFQHARKFTDAQLRTVREALTKDARCSLVDLPEEQMNQSIRLGLTALDMAVEQGYMGCTIKSWPELFDQYGCAADGAVSMLNDIGLCTTEEGEMNGLLSSLAMYLLSESRAITTMMDLSAVDRGENTLGLWHCGACPTRMIRSGSSFTLRKHSILENGDPETAVGMMVEFPLEVGAVTIMRYQSPDATTCLAFEGELIDTPMPFRGSYADFSPVADYTVSDIMGTILARGLDHHWSVGYGHAAADLRMFNHWMGIAEVSIDRHADLCGLSMK